MELTHADVIPDGHTMVVTFSDGYRASVLRRSGRWCDHDSYRVAVAEALEVRGIYGTYISQEAVNTADGWRYGLIHPDSFVPPRSLSDPRWTDETFRGASMAAFPGLPHGMTLAEAERRVAAVLRYLADRGLLVRPDRSDSPTAPPMVGEDLPLAGNPYPLA